MTRACVLALIALVLLGGCASSQRSALETAKLSYADASLAYEAAMTTIESLRANHMVTDAQMHAVIIASATVRRNAPAVRDAINLWESSGTKPQSYEATVKAVFDAVQIITNILAEVKK